MGKILKLEYENPKTHVKSSGRIEIRSQSTGSADLYFYGDICSSTWDLWQNEDMCPQDVADFLNGLNGIKNINVYINSGGGDSFAGKAIYYILARSGAHIEVFNDGLTASAAGMIAMAGCLPGNVLHMPPGAEFMMHKCWTIALGNANDFRAIAGALDKCDESYVEIFLSCALEGVETETIAGMMDAETWMNGAQLAAVFKNVDTSGIQIAASLDSSFAGRYRNVPEAIEKPQGKTAVHDGVVPPDISTDKAPEDETWTAPALGDFTDKTWDALSDREKRDIAGHFAWASEMPPDAYGNMKLGHHDPKTHNAVLAGIEAAAARLDQTDIPDADKPKVKAHLENHYHAFGRKAPWEPPEDEGGNKAKALARAKAALALSV